MIRSTWLVIGQLTLLSFAFILNQLNFNRNHNSLLLESLKWLISLSSLSYLSASNDVIRSIPMPFTKLDAQTASVTDNIYFVEFIGEYGSESNCNEDRLEFVKTLAFRKIPWLPRRQFCVLFNGMSFHANATDVARMAELNVVKAIWPMVSKRLPQYSLGDGSQASDPHENHRLTGVWEVQNKLGFDGTGVKIGIIDTGIDYLHPYLGGCFGPNCRVKYGKDLVGDDYDGSSKKPSPDNDPRDTCGGHGTHVAGIIGANGPQFKGVAPNVTFGAYRVFGCGPNARVESDVIIEAMEMAFVDKMDVINLSLGGGSAWSEYPDSVVANRLVQKGLIVVAAAGNDGDKGMWEISSPSIGPGVISSASFDSEKYMARAFSLSTLPASKIDYTISPYGPKFDVINATIVPAYDSAMEGCNPFPEPLHPNQVVLTKRGGCKFDVKAKNALNAGAAGLIIINNIPGTFTPLLQNHNETKIAVAGVSQTAGNVFLSQLDLLAVAPVPSSSSSSAPPTLPKVDVNPVLKPPKVRTVYLSTPKFFTNPNGGKISGFSSWGPGPELEIKPDLGAPGGLIFSTYPVDLGMYATLSGTSMATPYMAGVAALYLQSKGRRSPEDVKIALQNSCQPSIEKNSTLATSVTRQGAGLINALTAVTSYTTIIPSRIVLNSSYADLPADKFLNEDNVKPYFTQITVKNHSPTQTLEYVLDHLGAISVSAYKDGSMYPVPRQNTSEQAVVNYIPSNNFILRPNSEAVVKVAITPPFRLPLDEYWFFSGFLRATSNQTNQIPLHVPFLGVQGNYSMLPILANPSQKYPRIKLNRDNTEYNSTQIDPIQLTFQGQDYLTLEVRVEHPTRVLLIKVIQADTGVELGYITGGVNYYVGRNDQKANNQFYKFPWSGSCLQPDPDLYHPGALKPFSVQGGKFRLRVQALRPFGSPHNPHDFETWESGVLIISRTNETDVKQTYVAEVRDGFELKDFI
ncbi:subtilisin-like protein [Conidiobolus coronatus NRRL 28638]|uniref:Subtilisin-like protein n=1 Tax=Conidiobolus coronatus (strain ATCC 28846 / CBS 209.66 / NRRL 28638) TaxID=796925 RepID=A0A137PI40_CONC2|nr:subtilisin-like protein [Conidiobolus coronatus NRRL 28638]|eukprot:KXN74649.1 subtilisin-like protein [Conidiobolus coronatus NRRL 28638]